jgi:hypothetical protein
MKLCGAGLRILRAIFKFSPPEKIMVERQASAKRTVRITILALSRSNIAQDEVSCFRGGISLNLRASLHNRVGEVIGKLSLTRTSNRRS